MKRKLSYYLFFGLLAAGAVNAQTYQPLTVTSGYTADVIANGVGSAALSTTLPVDNANFAFMSNDFLPATITTPPTYGLPASGLINSLATTGLTYQMASLSSNNSLRIGATAGATSGTLAFSNGVNATKLYVLATSGSGQSTITALITFNDATTQTATALIVPDWFFSTLQPVAAQGFGRVNTTNNVLEPSATDPRLYQITVNIDAANQTKTVSSVQFTKTSTAEGVVNIFGVTAEVLPTCPAPSALVATTGPSNASVSWTAAVVTPGSGYDYYYSTANTAPTATTTPTGNVATGTTVSFPELITGQTYYFWVRSHCSDTDASAWVATSFTTGQVASTYTLGDISTLYNTAPTVTSTTECPGTLSVTVPAGYQISSVATSYVMTSANSGYQSEQRTMLYCTTTSLGETSLAEGTGNVGTYTYNRSGLTIANGATGTVNFEMRAWRMWGGSGCNTTYNKVDNNTWKVTVTYTCLPPAAPTAAPLTVCGTATVADLTATGTGESPVFNWYTAETGGTALATTASLTSGTYYVSQTNGTCESTRTAVVVTLTEAPAAPIAAPITLCGTPTVANLTATGTGTTPMLNWYAAATGGEPLAETVLLTSGTYYVSQINGTCESTRTAVAVTLTAAPAAPIAPAAQAFCPGATINDLEATPLEGATITWTYNGLPLVPGSVLIPGVFEASQTLNGCTSPMTNVTVTLNATAVPTVNAQAVCEGATLADLTTGVLLGATVNYYTTATGVAVPATTVAVTGTYYISQSVNGCESAQVIVDVVVNAIPDAPEGEAIQTFTTGQTVADLDVDFLDGATVVWYVENDVDGYNVIPSDTVLEDGVTYYTSQATNNCESEMFAVTANAVAGTSTFTVSNLKVYPNPANNEITVSNNAVISQVTVTNLLGQSVISQKATTDTVQVNLSSLSAGTYILQVTAGNGVSNVKVVKQ